MRHKLREQVQSTHLAALAGESTKVEAGRASTADPAWNIGDVQLALSVHI